MGTANPVIKTLLAPSINRQKSWHIKFLWNVKIKAKIKLYTRENMKMWSMLRMCHIGSSNLQEGCEKRLASVTTYPVQYASKLICLSVCRQWHELIVVPKNGRGGGALIGSQLSFRHETAEFDWRQLSSFYVISSSQNALHLCAKDTSSGTRREIANTIKREP